MCLFCIPLVNVHSEWDGQFIDVQDFLVIVNDDNVRLEVGDSMFVLNAYFCRELRLVAILRSKLRLLLRNSEVDSDFTQSLRKNLAGGVSEPLSRHLSSLS